MESKQMCGNCPAMRRWLMILETGELIEVRSKVVSEGASVRITHEVCYEDEDGAE